MSKWRKPKPAAPPRPAPVLRRTAPAIAPPRWTGSVEEYLNHKDGRFRVVIVGDRGEDGEMHVYPACYWNADKDEAAILALRAALDLTYDLSAAARSQYARIVELGGIPDGTQDNDGTAEAGDD